MGEKLIRCVIVPEQICPESCPNHEFAIEFRDCLIEWFEFRNDRKPSEEELGEYYKNTGLLDRTPIESGVFANIEKCFLYKEGKISLTLGDGKLSCQIKQI